MTQETNKMNENKENTANNVEKYNLPDEKINAIAETYNPYMDNAKALIEEGSKIEITDIGQLDEMQKARDIRLKLKNIRILAEKSRVEMKEDMVREGKAIDGMCNIIKALIVPIEKHLEGQEKYAERIEQERIKNMIAERKEKLLKYDENPEIYNLEIMTDESFEKLLSSSKLDYEERIEAERKEEAERIERERKEKEEQDRIRKENEQLKKEKEAREKQDELDRQARESAAKIQSEKEEADHLERQKKENKLKAEKEAAEKELQDKLAADQQKKEAAEKEEADRLAAIEEKKRLEENAPDKIKLLELANYLDSIKYPELQQDEAKEILKATISQIADVSKSIKMECESL